MKHGAIKWMVETGDEISRWQLHNIAEANSCKIPKHMLTVAETFMVNHVSARIWDRCLNLVEAADSPEAAEEAIRAWGRVAEMFPGEGLINQVAHQSFLELGEYLESLFEMIQD